MPAVTSKTSKELEYLSKKCPQDCDRGGRLLHANRSEIERRVQAKYVKLAYFAERQAERRRIARSLRITRRKERSSRESEHNTNGGILSTNVRSSTVCEVKHPSCSSLVPARIMSIDPRHHVGDSQEDRRTTRSLLNFGTQGKAQKRQPPCGNRISPLF